MRLDLIRFGLYVPLLFSLFEIYFLWGLSTYEASVLYLYYTLSLILIVLALNDIKYVFTKRRGDMLLRYHELRKNLHRYFTTSTSLLIFMILLINILFSTSSSFKSDFSECNISDIHAYGLFKISKVSFSSGQICYDINFVAWTADKTFEILMQNDETIVTCSILEI